MAKYIYLHIAADPSDPNRPSSETDLHLPPICKTGSKSNSVTTTKAEECDSFQMPLASLKLGTDVIRKEDIHTDAQRSISDTVWQLEDKAKIISEKALTDTETEKRRNLNAKKTFCYESSTPLNLLPWQQDSKSKTLNTCFDSSTTLNSSKNVSMSFSTEQNSELQKIQNNTTDENFTGNDISKLDM